MVVTDKGETGGNILGEWHGTMKAAGQKFVIPIDKTLQFVDDTIVKEFGYWDNTPVVEAFIDHEASQMASSNSLPEN